MSRRENLPGQPEFQLAQRTDLPPAFGGAHGVDLLRLRDSIGLAVTSWLRKTTSRHTTDAYAKDLDQFLEFHGVEPDYWEQLARIMPTDVMNWRDALKAQGLSNATIRRKLTALRSLFAYLQTYGYSGANPAHGDFVKAPAVPRDGKTVGLTPHDCRLLLDAPDPATPIGIRDRAILAVLAYTACRVEELVKLKVSSFKTDAEHRILEVHGKGDKERKTPLHPEAVERLVAWLEVSKFGDESGDPADHLGRGTISGAGGPLFQPSRSARGQGKDGFVRKHLTTRCVQTLVEKYVARLGLDPNVTVHSFRVTALTTARKRGVDIIDLQGFAGHADPRTTLTYIRDSDRLSKSPAYVLRY